MEIGTSIAEVMVWIWPIAIIYSHEQEHLEPYLYPAHVYRLRVQLTFVCINYFSSLLWACEVTEVYKKPSLWTALSCSNCTKIMHYLYQNGTDNASFCWRHKDLWMLRTELFWVIPQRVVVISYLHFGTTYRFHLQWAEESNNLSDSSSGGQEFFDSWHPEDGTDRLSRNVGKTITITHCVINQKSPFLIRFAAKGWNHALKDAVLYTAVLLSSTVMVTYLRILIFPFSWPYIVINSNNKTD